MPNIGLSREQMFRSQVILGIIKEFQSPGDEFQRFYRLGVGATPLKTLPGRTGSYDIVNPTRAMANPRSPHLPHPTQVQRKVLGNIPFTCMRFFEAVTLRLEDFMQLRAPGQGVGTIDPSGQQHIMLESNQLVTRNRTAREFMATRLFMGGWAVKNNGGDHDYLVEKGTSGAAYSINTRIPDEHLGDGPVGSDNATDIFAVKWNDPDCDIIGQFAELDFYSARVHGSRIQHIWMNSTMYPHLLNITQLRDVRGTANILFDRLTNRSFTPEGNEIPDTGFDVMFPSLPGRIFHFYNQGYVPEGTTDDFASQTGSAWTPFLPHGKAIMTPNPGPWCGVLAGSEYICKNARTAEFANVAGFDLWSEEICKPPGEMVTTLDNFMLALLEPYAAYYIDVYEE